MKHSADVVIIGAGQAGLAVSYHLKRAGVKHLVLERGRVGESWRSQRWDSFCLNTPNWANSLDGLTFEPGQPNSFGAKDSLISYLEQYVRSFDLPVLVETPVIGLERLATGTYVVQSRDGAFYARAVVVASGGMSRPRVPSIATHLSGKVANISAGDYRNAECLPRGAVVVVGTGQSGCQIAEDLLAGGRRVFVCASRVARVVRTYRGREILKWWRDMGFLETGIDELEDPSIQFATQPQVSGTDGGHTVSLQSLARDGATLLGRVTDVDGVVLSLGNDLLESVAFADERSEFFKKMIDDWIEREHIEAPTPSADPGEPPLPDLGGSDQRRQLDLEAEGVGTVIWCTGFDADWSWLNVDVFDDQGQPRHRRGVTDSHGLYFVGLPWLSKRNSGILLGASDDAASVANHLERHVLGIVS